MSVQVLVDSTLRSTDPRVDTAKARDFWGGLFGWQWLETEGPFEYHMTQISDQAGGAITKRSPASEGGAPTSTWTTSTPAPRASRSLAAKRMSRARCQAWAGSRPAGPPRGTSSGSSRTTRPPRSRPGKLRQHVGAETRSPPMSR